MSRPASTAAARPAAFDRASQHRRATIAKIQIARKQLAMDDDDYRQGVFDATGRLSLRDCSDAQLDAVLAWLKSKGFRPMGKKGAARHPVALKARALWISLWQLGVVHNPSEEALEAFATRQVGCDKLIWMRQSDGYQLVEALKGMGERKGWRMRGPDGRALGPIALKESLCMAILRRLKAFGVARADWELHDAAWKLCGIENAKATAWTAEDYARLAAALGAKLRDAMGGRHEEVEATEGGAARIDSQAERDGGRP